MDNEALAIPSTILSRHPRSAKPRVQQLRVGSDTTSSISSNPRAKQPDSNFPLFPLFPDLPTEIRLQIYCSTFPTGQHVCLDAGFPWTFNYEASIHAQNLLPLPIALSINRESRAEALKHYYIAFKHDSAALKGYEPFAERPFCFNPDIDSVYVTFGSLHGGTNYRRFDAWMEYLEMRLPGGTNAIQALEVRDMNWEAPIKAWIQGESPVESLVKWNKNGGLEWFGGLKELCFTQHRDADNGLRYRRNQYARWYAPITQRKFDEYATEVTNWFADYAEKIYGGRVPHVTVRGFKKVKWSALNREK